MTSAYVVIKWPACYKTCPVDRGARNFDDRISEVPLYCYNQMTNDSLLTLVGIRTTTSQHFHSPLSPHTTTQHSSRYDEVHHNTRHYMHKDPLKARPLPSSLPLDAVEPLYKGHSEYTTPLYKAHCLLSKLHDESTPELVHLYEGQLDGSQWCLL